MQKPANLGSVATRLNNLEQKFDENPGGGGTDYGPLIERIFANTFAGSETNWPGTGTSADETVFDLTAGMSLSFAVFGTANGGGPSEGLMHAVNHPSPFSFYDQVLGSGEYADALRAAGMLSLTYLIFGSTTDMSTYLSSSPSASLLARIESLEARVAALESA